MARSEPTDMTSDIEAALEEMEVVDDEEETEVVEAVVEEPDSSGEGEDTPPEVPEAGDAEPDSPEPESTAEEGEAPKEEDKGSSEPVDKAPDGLSADAREQWKDTPQAMKDAINKREEQFAQGIFQKDQAAKRAYAMDKAMMPHQQLFALTGNNPPEMVSNLLTTASVLQMGTPQQKAEIAAQIINDFGVDIAALDGVLSGQTVPRGTQQPQQPQMSVDQQVQQALQRERNAQMGNQVNGELQQFMQDPKNEFVKDVQREMLMVADGIAASGENLTLPQIYEQACYMNANVRSVMATRDQANRMTASKKAGISLSGSPGGESNISAKDESMSDTIRRAMNSSENRI
jgi:hypothetical protein